MLHTQILSATCLPGFQLVFISHCHQLVTSSTQAMYALRVLRTRGLGDAALQHVYRANVVARLTYAASAWRGLTRASDRQRINSVIDRTLSTAQQTCHPSANCVTPPTTNCFAKLPVFPITSCTHYSHHHPPHHTTIASDTAHTHYNFLHTPHT